MTNRAQWRATYEDTHTQQEELRKKLDVLITENRPIRDDKERAILFHLIGDSFLGEDGGKSIPYFLTYPTGRSISINDFGGIIRMLCYENHNSIPISFFGVYGNEVIPISEIWAAVRRESFKLFPLAQKIAISMSKEREKKERSTGANIDDA